MKAVIFHDPRNVTTENVDKPAITSADILIKVQSSCICGSDLHMYKLGLHSEIVCRKSESGLIPGHEFSGDVVEVGAEVEGLAVGDRVIAYTNGGMAEYVPVSAALLCMNVYKIPDEVSYTEAATIEPLANSVHAALKGTPAKGENAMVFGAGIIGLGVIQVLRALDIGLNKIIAVDVSDKRLEMARRLGADAVIHAGKEDIFQKAIEITGSEELAVAPGIPMPLVDIAYDCVGYIQDRPEPPVLQQAMLIVRPLTGRIVAHGIFEAPLTLDFSILVGKQIQIIGSFAMLPEETVKSIELIQSKKIDREILISHEFSLDQAKEAFETQCTVEDSIKVLINP
ncbi:MAG: zinc-binding dehydrogenase [Deltaproteobacteria bacterium]|nr:zinc-binding dehydrogenase [Deltaproteobacteria bacterium]